MTTTNHEPEGTACRMTEGHLKGLLQVAYDEGAAVAIRVAALGGSLGATREAAIEAFTHGYDLRATRLADEHVEQASCPGA